MASETVVKLLNTQYIMYHNKSMLFQLNVVHKDATVSWLQILFMITSKI